jgi:hypothetical protein
MPLLAPPPEPPEAIPLPVLLPPELVLLTTPLPLVPLPLDE